LGSKAPALVQLGEPRRTATLLAVARQLETSAVDDALDLFAALMTTRLVNPARRASQADRLAALPRLERASRTRARAPGGVGRARRRPRHDGQPRPQLGRAECGDGGGGEGAVAGRRWWTAVERVASRAEVTAAVAVVDELARDDEGGADAAARSALADRYRTVRPFVDQLGTAVALTGAPGGRRVLAAVRPCRAWPPAGCGSSR